MESEYIPYKEIDDIPIVLHKWKEIINLSEPQKDTIYIVSVIVAHAAKAAGRYDDIVCSGDFVCNKAGNVIDIRNLMFV